MEFTEEQLADPSEQLAPAEDSVPSFERVKGAFERTVADCGDELDRCKANYDTRYNIWPGQSSDGKKHTREGSNIEPTPWDGASDLKTFAADDIINLLVARSCLGLSRANLVAVPVTGTDLPRAKAVTQFMKWLVYTQIPGLKREAELAAQYRYEKGKAVIGVFWETCQDKVNVSIKVAELEAQMPGVADLLADPALEKTFIAQIQQQYGSSLKKAKQVLKDLREKGEASLPVDGRKYSRPVVRALSTDEDVWIHPSVTDIETAPAIFYTRYLTPTQLRSFVNTDGWSSEWVEKAIATCKGKGLSMLPDPQSQSQQRSITAETEFMADLVGVVYGYERLVDEDGVPGIYLSVFNPAIGPCEHGKHGGFAVAKLLGYSHGRYPFVLSRREYLTRRVHDSRGIPEVAKPFQDILKATSDGRIDAMSISIIPPLMYPQGRPPGKWGPGARVPYRRSPDEYRFGDRPAYDMNTTEVEKMATGAMREYFGLNTPEGDPAAAQTKQQHDIASWLGDWGQVFGMVWDLYKQFGDDGVYFRVLGVSSENAVKFDKGEAGESYDFYLSYDVLQTDREATDAKLETIGKIVATADKYGQVDYSQFLQLLLESVDPSIAERILLPKDSATEKVVKEEREALTQIAGGFDLDIDPRNPAQICLGVMQQWMQAPDVQKRMMTDEPFRDRVTKRAKQWEHQLVQAENSRIGKLGA